MGTMTVRLERWLKEDVESFSEAQGERPSSGLRRVVQEWWAGQHFPALTFRDGVSGRRAVLRDGPDVWEVVMIARDYGDDRPALQEHFCRVSPDALNQALAYAERFPEEIDAMIAENERVARLLGDTG